MIIDIHSHVFAFPKLKWRADSTPLLSPVEQIRIMDKKGIEKAVILPLANAEVPIEVQSLGEVLYICQQYPDRFVPFCNFDPRLGLNPDKITLKDYVFRLEQCKEYGCKGFGELTARMPFDHPLILMLFEACQEMNLPVCFHTITQDWNTYGLIDEIGLPRFERVLKTFPSLKFFGHSPAFWSEISGEVTSEDKNGYPQKPVKPGGKIIDLMRKHPNLYGDLSAGSGLNALRRDEEHAYKFIDEFQSQLLLGLDYCSTENDMQHVEWFTAAKDAKSISESAYEKIMWKNANKVLCLGLE